MRVYCGLVRIENTTEDKMTKDKRGYWEKKYRHLNLHFDHGQGWDELTLIAAIELDLLWPLWMPNWFKRFNNLLLYKNKGYSIVNTTKFHYSKLRKLFPFIKEYPRFFQIKEKFGGLRLYGAGKLESSLEALSYLVCEKCGSGHNIGYTKGWIKTLCKTCAENSGTGIDTWTPKNK